MSRLYFHAGSVYRYAPWQPITINDTAPYEKPLYYGNLFNAAALAGEDSQVVSIANESTFAAYAIYAAGDGALRSVAVVNLAMFNSTQDEDERVVTVVTLPDVADWSDAEVRRLTAPGVEVKMGVTFAGRSVDEDGNLGGDEDVEAVEDGTVSVGAGEAVLVTL